MHVIRFSGNERLSECLSWRLFGRLRRKRIGRLKAVCEVRKRGFVTDDIEDVWDQFLDAFAEQFQDSQKGERAHTGLESIKMTWPLIDQYIQDFEQLAAEAGYTLGVAPTNRYFVRGLVPSMGKDVFKPSPSDDYQVLKKRAVNSVISQKAIN